MATLIRLHAEGNTLILWTCKKGELLEEAVRFCRQQGLEFDYINENTKERINAYGGDTRKVTADFYVDDKNIDAERLAAYDQFAEGRRKDPQSTSQSRVPTQRLERTIP